MTHRHINKGKIAIPAARDVLERGRLFKALDRGREGPIIWISGPGGAGKTTLVSSYIQARGLPAIWYQMDEGDADPSTFFYYLSHAVTARSRRKLPYLTPEYAMGAEIFAKRFFEQLFAEVTEPCLMVFDNFQTVEPAGAIARMLAENLALAPAGVTTIIVSRARPPQHFAQHAMGGRMKTIEWDDLQLTRPEAAEVAFLRGGQRAAGEAFFEKSHGWIAALVLMIEHGGRAGGRQAAFEEQTPEEVFDYFSAEIFDHMAPKMREFLTRIAYLPSTTAEAATAASGEPEAGAILDDLCRSNYFVLKKPLRPAVYTIHPLFHEFLRARSDKALDPGQRRALLVRSARACQGMGNVELAAELFRGAEAWDELSGLVRSTGPELLMQGRNHEVSSWISALPEAARAAEPGILYLGGMALQPFAPARARREFEAAFEGYRAGGDRMGMLTAWCRIIECIFYWMDDFNAMDPWIHWMLGHLEQSPGFPDTELEIQVTTNMAVAFMIRRPWDAEARAWAKRAGQCAGECPDVEMKIRALMASVNYFIWVNPSLIPWPAIKPVIDRVIKGNATPLVKLNALFVRCIVEIWAQPDLDSALEGVEIAHRIAGEHGVFVLNEMFNSIGGHAAIVAGRHDLGERLIHEMEPLLSPDRRVSYCLYLYLLSGKTCHDNIAAALALSQKALEMAEATGYVFCEILCRQVHALCLSGNARHAEALDHAHRALDDSRHARSEFLEYMALLKLAWVFRQAGDEAGMVGCITEGFSLARRYGFYSLLWWWQLPVLAALSAEALARGIETTFVQRLIRFKKLSPPDATVPPKDWPWRVRVRTLGGFGVSVDGAEVSAKGRGMQKPLELFQVFIAQGGREIGSGTIADALWPNADGDSAYSSFTTTLSRLRKLLGEDIVVTRGGMFRLNQNFCTVDAHCFADHSGRGEFREAIALYSGEFLPGQTAPWAVTYRERLRAMHLHALMKLGEAHMMEREYGKAAECYHRAIEQDALREQPYQRLIVCHLEQGLGAEAAKVYDACERALANGLNIAPSPQTRALLGHIR
jgi:DNA-binding SARP family transcriptional activator